MTSKEKNISRDVVDNVSGDWWWSRWRSRWENIQIVIVALLLALLIRAFVAEPRYIPSDSMMPTLHVSDRLVVEKLSYRFRQPATGDIIVFSPPNSCKSRVLLKIKLLLNARSVSRAKLLPFTMVKFTSAVSRFRKAILLNRRSMNWKLGECQKMNTL